MGEMLEEAAILAHMPAQHRLAVILVPAPENVMMGPGDDPDGIELDKAEPLDQGIEIERAGRRGCEP